MQDLFIFLTILMVVATIIFMIKPELAKDFKEGQLPKRSELLVGGLVLIIGFYALSESFSPSEASIAASVQHEIAPETIANEDVPQKHEAEKTLNITPEQFKTQFNEIANKAQADFKISDMEIKKGEVLDVANVKLNKNSSLVLSVSHQGLLTGVTSISVGDGTASSGLNMMLVTAVLFRTFNKTLDAESANKISLGLLTDAVNKSDGKPITKIFEGFKFYTMFSKNLGYWCGVEAV
jgi:hypothetical protein